MTTQLAVETGHLLRCIWPITDTHLPLDTLIREAAEDLPELAARARASVTHPGSWHVARSCTIPGSGNITATVLVYEAPAVPRPPRPYRSRP